MLLRIIISMSLACCSIVACANEAVIRDVNAPQLNVYYKIVHQDKAGQLHDSKVQKVHLAPGMVVSIPLSLNDDDTYVGIVPVRVNDRVLMSTNTNFNQSGTCSVATGAQADKGTLVFGYQEANDAYYCQPYQAE